MARFSSTPRSPSRPRPAPGGRDARTRGGRSWQTLSLAGTRASIAMAELAVSPENPHTLLATTQQGLVRSTDDGRSFALIAVADGIVASSDGGRTFQTRYEAG